MVIGEGYAWAHLPKTGGDATLAMFRLFPDLVEFADPDDTNDKHTQFHSRARLIRGKLLVMNFRRLPSWVLSRALHVSRRGIHPDYKPQPMGTLTAAGPVTTRRQALSAAISRSPRSVSVPRTTACSQDATVTSSPEATSPSTWSATKDPRDGESCDGNQRATTSTCIRGQSAEATGPGTRRETRVRYGSTASSQL